MMTQRTAVLQAIKETDNWRGNLADVASRATTIYHAAWREYTMDRAVRLFKGGSPMFAAEALKLRNDALAGAVKAGGDFGLPVTKAYAGAVRKDYLRRYHGIAFDARTHRDVPGRDMRETLASLRKSAANRQYAVAA